MAATTTTTTTTATTTATTIYWTLSERALLIAGELYPWHQTVQDTSVGELRISQSQERKDRKKQKRSNTEKERMATSVLHYQICGECYLAE